MGVPPAPSAVQNFISTYPAYEDHDHDAHLVHLVLQIAYNLRYQHGWTHVRIHHETSSNSPDPQKLPGPMISGLPPRRLYVHPDEQIELLQKQKDEGKSGMPNLELEREWVLPSHLREKWSLRRFGEVFDAVTAVPSDKEGKALFEESTASSDSQDPGPILSEAESAPTNKWRTSQPKRILLATLDDDSTIVYYIVHDGLVKPRQN